MNSLNCDKWNANKKINPLTNKRIKENGPVYKKLSKMCDNNLKLHCDKWAANKTINPLTKKRIKENGPIYNMFKVACAITKPPKRISSDINDRINYYNIVKKYVDDIKLKHKNNCIKFYKIDHDEVQYSVGSNIILHKKLGQGGFGAVYSAYFRPSDITKREYCKQFKLVVKICEITNKNRLEIDILLRLTQLITMYKICPHFPITYGYLVCNKYNYPYSNSMISSAQSSTSIYQLKSQSEDFMDKPNLYLIVNELADTSLRDIIRRNSDINIAINIILQSMISIVFFQKYIKLSHRDTHGGNFLCHRIEPGGYYHYRIYNTDYYLENIGYLMVINDFGLVKKLTNKMLMFDFTKFISSFLKHNSSNSRLDIISHFMRSVINKFMLIDIESYHNLQFAFYKHLFKTMNLKFPNHFMTSRPANVINKTPYIIE